MSPSNGELVQGSTGDTGGAAFGVPGVFRWALIVVGGLAVVLGIVLVLHPFKTATVLAILIGIELILSGLLDLIDQRYSNKALSIGAGVVGIGAGVLTIVWPNATLWVIAVAVGFSFLLRGIAQLIVAFGPDAEMAGAKGMLVFAGVVSSAVGIAVLVWPHATIVVLAVLLGIRVLFVGLLQIAAGIALGKVTIEAGPAA